MGRRPRCLPRRRRLPILERPDSVPLRQGSRLLGRMCRPVAVDVPVETGCRRSEGGGRASRRANEGARPASQRAFLPFFPWEVSSDVFDAQSRFGRRSEGMESRSLNRECPRPCPGRARPAGSYLCRTHPDGMAPTCMLLSIFKQVFKFSGSHMVGALEAIGDPTRSIRVPSIPPKVSMSPLCSPLRMCCDCGCDCNCDCSCGSGCNCSSSCSYQCDGNCKCDCGCH